MRSQRREEETNVGRRRRGRRRDIERPGDRACYCRLTFLRILMRRVLFLSIPVLRAAWLFFSASGECEVAPKRRPAARSTDPQN